MQANQESIVIASASSALPMTDAMVSASHTSTINPDAYHVQSHRGYESGKTPNISAIHQATSTPPFLHVSNRSFREEKRAQISTSTHASVVPLEEYVNAAMATTAVNQQASLTALQKQQHAVSCYHDYSRLPIDNLRDPSSFIYSNGSTKEPPFPLKLHEILSNPEYEDMICWLPHGRSWRVRKPKAFEEKVIPLHFRHCRYSSFMRQVNGWGFKRVLRGPDVNSYYHELFLRGLPHLSLKMHRLVGGGKLSLVASTHEEASPDFYSISARYPLPPRQQGSNPDTHGEATTTPTNSSIGHLGQQQLTPGPPGNCPHDGVGCGGGGGLRTKRLMPSMLPLCARLDQRFVLPHLLHHRSGYVGGLDGTLSSLSPNTTAGMDQLPPLLEAVVVRNKVNASPLDVHCRRLLARSGAIMKTNRAPEASLSNPHSGVGWNDGALAEALTAAVITKELTTTTCRPQDDSATTTTTTTQTTRPSPVVKVGDPASLATVETGVVSAEKSSESPSSSRGGRTLRRPMLPASPVPACPREKQSQDTTTNSNVSSSNKSVNEEDNNNNNLMRLIHEALSKSRGQQLPRKGGAGIAARGA